MNLAEKAPNTRHTSSKSCAMGLPAIFGRSFAEGWFAASPPSLACGHDSAKHVVGSKGGCKLNEKFGRNQFSHGVINMTTITATACCTQLPAWQTAPRAAAYGAPPAHATDIHPPFTQNTIMKSEVRSVPAFSLSHRKGTLRIQNSSIASSSITGNSSIAKLSTPSSLFSITMICDGTPQPDQPSTQRFA